MNDSKQTKDSAMNNNNSNAARWISDSLVTLVAVGSLFTGYLVAIANVI